MSSYGSEPLRSLLPRRVTRSPRSPVPPPAVSGQQKPPASRTWPPIIQIHDRIMALNAVEGVIALAAVEDFLLKVLAMVQQTPT
jgi:hypothetical protein